jgi:hypothetical protein
MKEKISVPKHVQEIYEQWAAGPTADEYYNAVEAYFKAKERTTEYSEVSTYGRTTQHGK